MKKRWVAGALAALLVLLQHAHDYFVEEHTYIVPICKALLSQSVFLKALS